MEGKFNIVFIAVFVVMIAACSKNKNLITNKEVIIPSTAYIADTLVGTIIGSAQGSESHIDCAGDYLVITSDRPHSYISLISLQSDSTIIFFGDRGHAGNEFFDVPRVPYISNDNCNILYCQADTKNATKAINLSQSIEMKTCVVDTEYVHKEIYKGHTTFLLSRDRSISKHDMSYEDARDNIFYPPYFTINNGEKKYEIEIFSDIIETALPSLFFVAYADMLRIKPDGRKVVQVFYHIDMFGIIDTETGHYASYSMPDSYGFDFFEQLDSQDDAYKKVCVYNVDVCVTDKYIMLLRDERPAQDVEERYEEKVGSEVMIFDWDANHINTIFVAEHLKDIAFSDSNNTLYGIASNELIYKYTFDNE